jgi:hypothetical protein
MSKFSALLLPLTGLLALGSVAAHADSMAAHKPSKTPAPSAMASGAMASGAMASGAMSSDHMAAGPKAKHAPAKKPAKAPATGAMSSGAMMSTADHK